MNVPTRVCPWQEFSEQAWDLGPPAFHCVAGGGGLVAKLCLTL